MKLYIVMMIALIFGSSIGPLYAQEFSDIEGHQYSESIEYLQNLGIVKGYPDGTFGVDRNITRAEMMKIVLEASQESSIGDLTHCFTDVTDQWFARYICFASQSSMVKGIGNNNFGPDNNVTIAEGLKIAINAFDYGITEGVGNTRYMPYLNLAHNNNILSKYAIYPDDPMTRGQMTYLVHQLIRAKSGDRVMDNIRQVASEGCGATPPSPALGEVNLNGQTRHYITTIGKNYSPDSPVALVIAFHGRTNSNDDLRKYLKLNKVSQDNAIIVYPSGLPEGGPTRNRQNGGDPRDQLRDFALFDEIVKQFSQNYCINIDQIYVIGHSLGAWFTNTLACARGDVIRGMGSVGGSITSNHCTGPVASIIMHHPEDNLASFGGGVAARDSALVQNRCTNSHIGVGPTIGHCVEYECLPDAPVIRCPHTESNTWGYYYPHTRPNFATPMIWSFWNGLNS